QSIGVPQPLKLFGTPEQKKKYLPRCAAGAISAFALTEPHVGSDPASLSTTAELHGDTFVLNGEKLWCTNGTMAALLVVMAGAPNEPKQWGVPIWRHEAIAHRIADLAARTFAMDSISKLASAMADRGGYDIRLEAAAAKEWNTVRAWEIADATLQIRGGRGYE